MESLGVLPALRRAGLWDDLGGLGFAVIQFHHGIYISLQAGQTSWSVLHVTMGGDGTQRLRGWRIHVSTRGCSTPSTDKISAPELKYEY